MLRYLRELSCAARTRAALGGPIDRRPQGLWRYRVGDYRIVAAIEEDRFGLVLVVTVGHRREVYR